ncbi:glycoside hydrolase family 3 protein [Microbacterium sp. XT11]|uniref:glycoside hydrolase family 3 protein n=1 Tax=Microbacterium sp. XT11 TaxID=367477 RepID=UPI000742EA69|nr:glycoside hydrolase family 3 N-terminal domain-containing protein [Microbacterium sp. XT11]ALX65828.1 hypothetical protein AB663_000565 [Microbacterium sp. XT11]
MSDEFTRLANGVVWPGFFGTRAPEWLRAELRDGLAGVVYFGQNVGDELDALSAEILEANPDALIGVDEEGGSVTRLERASGSTLPGAAQLGVVDDTAVSRAVGVELARRLRTVGANVALGPVADVNTNPRNPVIGVRAFGADAELVSRHAVAMIDGIQSGAVAACAKHFPGHGDTHLDSHHALPEISLDTAEYERVHLAPFRAAVDAGVDMIMTAHIVVPAWGSEPATLNPAILGILRGWGFDGVIVTDALDMAAIRESVGIGQGAVRALAAGADLLCIGNPTNPGAKAAADQDEQDFRAARDAIVTALREGVLPVERVREAAERVSRLARALRAQSSARPLTALPAADLADVVQRAVGVTGHVPAVDGPLAVVDARRRSTLAVDTAADFVSEVLRDGGTVRRIDATGAGLGDGEIPAGQMALVVVDGPELTAAQRTAIDVVARRGPGVVVNVGLPVEAALPLAVIDVRATNRAGVVAALSLIRGTTRGAA